MEEAAAELEAGELADHLDEALVRRPVEAVELLDLFDLLGVDALAPAVDAAGTARRGTARLATQLAALQLRHHLLDRTARHELHDDKGDEHDAEKRRNHEQQPLEDVGPHS